MGRRIGSLLGGALGIDPLRFELHLDPSTREWEVLDTAKGVRVAGPFKSKSQAQEARHTLRSGGSGNAPARPVRLPVAPVMDASGAAEELKELRDHAKDSAYGARNAFGKAAEVMRRQIFEPARGAPAAEDLLKVYNNMLEFFWRASHDAAYAYPGDVTEIERSLDTIVDWKRLDRILIEMLHASPALHAQYHIQAFEQQVVELIRMNNHPARNLWHLAVAMESAARSLGPAERAYNFLGSQAVENATKKEGSDQAEMALMSGGQVHTLIDRYKAAFTTYQTARADAQRNFP